MHMRMQIAELTSTLYCHVRSSLTLYTLSFFVIIVCAVFFTVYGSTFVPSLQPLSSAVVTQPLVPLYIYNYFLLTEPLKDPVQFRHDPFPPNWNERGTSICAKEGSRIQKGPTVI